MLLNLEGEPLPGFISFEVQCIVSSRASKDGQSFCKRNYTDHTWRAFVQWSQILSKVIGCTSVQVLCEFRFLGRDRGSQNWRGDVRGRQRWSSQAKEKTISSPPKILRTLTHSTPLDQSRIFNKLWNLGQISDWFCLAKGEKKKE